MIEGFLARRRSLAARRAGDQARDAREWNTAAVAYRRYLKMRPHDAAIWIQLGHALSEQEDYSAADRAYHSAWLLDPRDSDLLLCWGHSRRRAGDGDIARDLYARSFKVDGNGEAAQLLAEMDALPTDQPASRQDVGRIETVARRTVGGVALHFVGASTRVVFQAGNRVVGEALLNGPLRDGLRGFKTELDLDGEAEVRAFRQPGGAELSGSPFRVDARAEPPPPDPAWIGSAEIVKPLSLVREREAAVFATYSTTGTLKPHVPPYLAALRRAGIAVVLVAMTDRVLNVPPELTASLDAVLVRHNGGFDFGAWGHALKLWPALYGASTLFLADDRLAGPTSQAAFETLLARVRASSADLVGLTESHEHGWHPQRHFMAMKPAMLAASEVQSFWDRVEFHIDEERSARTQEIAFARLAEQGGRTSEILFPSLSPIDPIVHDAGILAAAGSPFVALEAVEKARADDPKVAAALLDPGRYTAGRVEATIDAAPLRVPRPEGDTRLSARAPPSATDPNRLRIAFVGRWDRADREGQIARAMVDSLRTAADLNVHALSERDECSSALAPAVGRCDHAVVDVAIIALGPGYARGRLDQPPADARKAPLQIGWWSATDEAVPGNEDVASVDCLWVASAAMAELLKGQLDVPVDVVLPANGPADYEAVATRIEQRIRLAQARRRPSFARRSEPLRPCLLAGIPVESAQLGPDIHAIPLSPIGAVDETTRAALETATSGDDDPWLAFAPAGALLAPLFARTLREYGRVRPKDTLFYADDIAVETEEPIDQLRLKPEFDLTLLAAQDYVGAPLMMRASTLQRLGTIDAARGTAAVADLLFRAHAADMPIARIPEVLLAHPGLRIRARPDDYLAMLRAQPHLAHLTIAPGLVPDSFALSRPFRDGTSRQ